MSFQGNLFLNFFIIEKLLKKLVVFKMEMQSVTVVEPGNFSCENHWYPKALNATIHPMVNFFLNLSKERIISRYCHLHPKVDRAKLNEILSYSCKYYLWSGADLINATSENGKR